MLTLLTSIGSEEGKSDVGREFGTEVVVGGVGREMKIYKGPSALKKGLLQSVVIHILHTTDKFSQ